LAGRFRGTTLDKPRQIDCVLVTHGDADHFAGLAEIHKSEEHKEPLKRLFMQPRRVYHNGLVKRPSTRNKKRVPDAELLGPTQKVGNKLMLTGLEDDLLQVPDDQMNKPFLEWKRALKAYNKRQPVEFRRLEYGDKKAFDFFNTRDMRIEVLGPLTNKVAGKPALKFLGDPPRGPRLGHESLSIEDESFNGLSASHTINGHSIVFRLTYGGFSFLFSGDLNDEASRFLARKHRDGRLDLKADVFKVPHHGSADFSGAFLQSVSPLVSVVSSGDESARKEYIHPRATLIGALGKWSRVEEPLIFVTEMVAFFQMEGWSRLTDEKKSKTRGSFFAFSRPAYGIVKTRTDGKRLLVYTDSGNVQMKEAYAYTLDDNKRPKPAAVKRA
jgi:ribonuclease BN (tRNA processing enzyme)